MDGKTRTSDYVNDFDPLAYLQTYYPDRNGDPTEGDLLPKILTFLHESFAENKISGKRLLDFGTGPTVHSIISASVYVDNIFLSDFLPGNRDVLKRWLNGDLDHSFEDIIRCVVDLEGNGETPEERERMMRDKVSGIIPVNIMSDDLLAPNFFPKFDVITSSFCFQSASKDVDMYIQAAGRVSNILKRDGYLVLVGVLGISYYMVGKKCFNCLYIKAETVKRIWKDLGYKIINWKESAHSDPKKAANTDFEGFFVMVAQK